MDRMTCDELFRCASLFGIKYAKKYKRAQLETMIKDKMKVIEETPKKEICLGELKRNDLISVATTLFIKVGLLNKEKLRHEIIEVNDIIGLYIIRDSIEYSDDMTVRDLRKHLKGVNKHGAKSKEDLLKIATGQCNTKKEDPQQTGIQKDFGQRNNLQYEYWPVDELIVFAKSMYGIENTCGKSIISIIEEIRKNDEFS